MAAKNILCFLALALTLVGSSSVNTIIVNSAGLDGSSYNVFGQVDTALMATAPQMVAISGCKFIIGHIQGSGIEYTLYRTRVSCELKTDDGKKALDTATSPTFALGVTTDGASYGFLFIKSNEIYFSAYSFRDDTAEGSAVQISPSSDGTLTYQYPTLVGINTTHFIAAWNTYDGTNAGHVFYSVVSAAGAVSTPVQISESLYGYYMSNPVVAKMTNGSFIFFWQSATSPTSTTWQLRAKAYTSLFVQEKNSYVLNTVTGVTNPLICGVVGISDATFVVSYTYTHSLEQNTYFTIAYVSAVEEVSTISSAIEKNTYGLPFKYYNMFGMVWTSLYTNDTLGVLSNLWAKTGSLASDVRTLAWNAGLEAVAQGTDGTIYTLFSEYHDGSASRTGVYIAQAYNQSLSGTFMSNTMPVVMGLAIACVLIY